VCIVSKINTFVNCASDERLITFTTQIQSVSTKMNLEVTHKWPKLFPTTEDLTTAIENSTSSSTDHTMDEKSTAHMKELSSMKIETNTQAGIVKYEDGQSRDNNEEPDVLENQVVTAGGSLHANTSSSSEWKLSPPVIILISVLSSLVTLLGTLMIIFCCFKMFGTKCEKCMRRKKRKWGSESKSHSSPPPSPSTSTSFGNPVFDNISSGSSMTVFEANSPSLARSRRTEKSVRN